MVREPPHNLEAEKAILGGMILEEYAVNRALESGIKADDFYSEIHKETFEVIVRLFDEGKNINLISLQDELDKGKPLIDGNCLEYLVNMTDSITTTTNTSYYCSIVIKKSSLRKIIKRCSDFCSMAYDCEDILDIQQGMESLLIDDLDRVSNKVTDIKTAADQAKSDIENRIKNRGSLPGLLSGFTYWDYKTGGLIQSLLYLVAARPSMGKTAFLLNIIIYLCGYLKRPVLFFSLEMSKTQVINRLVSMVTEIENQKVKTGNLVTNEIEKVNKTLEVISKWPLLIDDTSGMSLQEVSAKARKAASQHKDLALVCLDHLTEMSLSGKDDRQGTTANVRGCKRIAKQLSIPFILLCQLNRAVESRNIKIPSLSDLRESGAIEEVADIISFLYRENYYNPESDPREAQVIVAKNRDGELGTVRLHWYGSITKFKNPVQPF